MSKRERRAKETKIKATVKIQELLNFNDEQKRNDLVNEVIGIFVQNAYNIAVDPENDDDSIAPKLRKVIERKAKTDKRFKAKYKELKKDKSLSKSSIRIATKAIGDILKDDLLTMKLENFRINTNAGSHAGDAKIGKRSLSQSELFRDFWAPTIFIVNKIEGLNMTDDQLSSLPLRRHIKDPMIEDIKLDLNLGGEDAVLEPLAEEGDGEFIFEPEKLEKTKAYWSIDLGTTNSSISWYKSQNDYGTVNFGKGYSIPSMIYYDNGKLTAVEDRDFSTWNERTIDDSHFFIEDWKISGMAKTDADKPLPEIDSSLPNYEDINPINLSAIIIKKLIRDAELRKQVKIEKIGISIPANFGEIARKNTMSAAMKALGMTNVAKAKKAITLRLEPNCAAASIFTDEGERSDFKEEIKSRKKGRIKKVMKHANYVVFDFGGGTTDIAFVSSVGKLLSRKMIFKHNRGFPLGGKMIDELIYEKIVLKQFLEANGLPNGYESGIDLKLKNLLMFFSEKLKIKAAYSKPGEAVTHADNFKDHGLDEDAFNDEIVFKTTYDEIKEIAVDLFNKVNIITYLKEAEIFSEHSEGGELLVVFAGGSSSANWVKEMVSDCFEYRGIKLVKAQSDIDDAISLGGAVYAMSKYSDKIEYLDTTSKFFGVGIYDRERKISYVDIAIPANVQTPYTSASSNYAIHSDKNDNTRSNIRAYIFQSDYMLSTRTTGEIISIIDIEIPENAVHDYINDKGEEVYIIKHNLTVVDNLFESVILFKKSNIEVKYQATFEGEIFKSGFRQLENRKEKIQNIINEMDKEKIDFWFKKYIDDIGEFPTKVGKDIDEKDIQRNIGEIIENAKIDDLFKARIAAEYSLWSDKK